MIIKDTMPVTGHVQREVILTDNSAKYLSENFGVDTLSNLSPEQARSLYASLRDLQSANQSFGKTRYRNEVGEIELDSNELGDELYSAMLPKPVDSDIFDPLYSEVELILKVMKPQDSEMYDRFCKGKPGEVDTSDWDAIVHGASIVLRLTFEPPNLAS